MALPAVASVWIDPILAKIEKCKAAWAEYGHVCEREPENQGFTSREHDGWEEAQAGASDKWSTAFDDMLATQPTTRQRAVALIDCFIESEQDMADEDYLALLESLRAYLQSAA
jgi:hypothetical protein